MSCTGQEVDVIRTVPRWAVMQVDLMPEILGPHDPPKPVKETKCVITGLPAKYKDPLTGAPYATIEAFRLLRQRHARRTGGMS